VLVVVNFLWAAQYPAAKIASERMSASGLGFWTLSSATALLLPFLWIERRKSPATHRNETNLVQTIRRFAVLGVIGIVPPSVMMAWGIARSTSSNASVLSLTIPVLITVLSVFMLREKLTALRVTSLLMAFGGTLVISWSDFGHDLLQARLLLGNIFIFLGGAGSAFYNVYGKRLLRQFSELEVLVYGYVAGIVSCGAISWFGDPSEILRPVAYPWSTWVAILVLGGLSWGVAMLMWMWVLKRMDASQISVSIYLLPVFGVLLSALVLNERPGLSQIVGALLVLVATYLVSDYEARKLENAATGPSLKVSAEGSAKLNCTQE